MRFISTIIVCAVSLTTPAFAGTTAVHAGDSVTFSYSGPNASARVSHENRSGTVSACGPMTVTFRSVGTHDYLFIDGPEFFAAGTITVLP